MAEGRWVRTAVNPGAEFAMCVADAYDAMTTDRAYRQALPHVIACGELERCSATQFDPDIAGTFTERIEMLREELRATGVEPPE